MCSAYLSGAKVYSQIALTDFVPPQDVVVLEDFQTTPVPTKEQRFEKVVVEFENGQI
jgi:hypothetical protein